MTGEEQKASTGRQAAAPDPTAERVALWRAMHVQVDPLPHVLEDEIGLALAAPDAKWRDRPDMAPHATKPFRASIVARARFVEDLVVEQAGRGVRQYVILGAGLDTFAQRRPEIASRLTVFEVDRSAVVTPRRTTVFGGGRSMGKPSTCENRFDLWHLKRFVVAAVELFTEQGYDATTVAQIAERAGVTTSTFFRYFPDKRDLLVAGQETLSRLLVEGIAEAPDGATPLKAVAAGLERASSALGR